MEGLVNRRDYSSKELFSRLVEDGYTRSVSQAIVELACEVGILDDARFGAAFARSKVLSGWGRIKIERELMLETVQRVALMTTDKQNSVRLKIADNCLEISAQDLGFSLAAYEKIDCTYEGDDLTIGFKSTFLIEILGNMDCENITLKFADGSRPAVIVPSDGEEDCGKICGILMPSIAS